jgi:signal-transduction protein with cAMP-binding, CBS, and nucleotidyltransferase domain
VKVVEFMTTNIRYVVADQTVYEAIEQMVDRRTRSLIVKFSELVADCGVITSRDIVTRVLSKGQNPEKVKVAEIASRPLVCVEKTATMRDVAGMMEDRGIARVFVCEKGKLIGVVSMIDLMSAALIMRARGEQLV